VCDAFYDTLISFNIVYIYIIGDSSSRVDSLPTRIPTRRTYQRPRPEWTQ